MANLEQEIAACKKAQIPRPLATAFIHSGLDDFGLNAAEFRVYCHLVRRAGKDGAYPAVASIAAVCRLNPKTVQRCLKFLCEHRLVSVRKRVGETNVYQLRPRSDWIPVGRCDGNPHSDALVLNTAGSPSEGMPDPHTQSDTHKGNPREGNSYEIDPHVREHALNEGSSFLEEAVYAAYPKHVGKPAALKEIDKAIRKYGHGFVLKRTQQFAAAMRSSPPRFIPYPAKWFAEERFRDDPATWRHISLALASSAAMVRQDQFETRVGKR